MRKKFLRQSAIVFCFLFLAFPLFSQQSKKITWGVYGGWSWGTGYTFRWHYRPWSDRHVLQFHLGGYAQLNLSQRIGLQLDFNYQSVLDEWIFHLPRFPYDSGEDSLGVSSVSLKGIYSLSRWNPVQLYFAGGWGINWGEWYRYSGVYYHLVGNPGVKIFLWKSNPNVALNLGSSFIYIYVSNQWDSFDDFYIRLNFGIEF